MIPANVLYAIPKVQKEPGNLSCCGFFIPFLNVVITVSIFPDKIQGKKKRHTFCDRNREPDSVYPKNPWKDQDIDHDQNECPHKGNDRGSFPVGKCGEHGRRKNVQSRKEIVEGKQEKAGLCDQVRI